jgi:hypothetical protein
MWIVEAFARLSNGGRPKQISPVMGPVCDCRQEAGDLAEIAIRARQVS